MNKILKVICSLIFLLSCSYCDILQPEDEEIDLAACGATGVAYFGCTEQSGADCSSQLLVYLFACTETSGGGGGGGY